jgi:hypothetical protein
MTLTLEELVNVVFYKPTWPHGHHSEKQKLTDRQREINRTCRNILILVIIGLIIFYLLYRYG